MKKIAYVMFFLLLFLIQVSAILAQEESIPLENINLYDKGDQIFSLHAGLLVPLFFANPNPEAETAVIPAYEHLFPGGFGYIEWGGFLNPDMTLGLEFGGIFAVSNANRRILFMVPVTAKYTYLLRFYPLEVPLSVGIGVNVSKLNDQLFFGPVAKIGAGLLVDLQNEWSLGGNLHYLIVPEIYFGDKSDKTRIANFLTLSFSAQYHF